MNVGEQKWDLGGGQTDQLQYNSQNYSTWHNSSCRERKVSVMVRGTWKKLIASFSSTSSSANAANTKEEESTCAICLDPLNCCTSAVFTAKCGHAFHLSCISSYVGHGGLTCPICRAHLPRNTNEPLPVRHHHHRHHHHHHHHHHHRLHIDLYPRPSPVLVQSSSAAYDVCVRLEHPPPTDLVLVATPTPTAPYLGQAMALVILSLRPQDRLSIVAHSARISPLTPMTPYAKQIALQLIHQSFFHSHNKPCSPAHALNKGIQVLHDRVYTNPQSHILHLSHNPPHLEGGVHCYHVGCSFLLHRFQQFLTRMLRGDATQIQIKMDGIIIQVGELRGGEHRKLPLLLPKCSHYCAEYSYIDGGTNKVTGEMLIRIQSDAHYDGSNKTAQVFTWK